MYKELSNKDVVKIDTHWVPVDEGELDDAVENNENILCKIKIDSKHLSRQNGLRRKIS